MASKKTAPPVLVTIIEFASIKKVTRDTVYKAIERCEIEVVMGGYNKNKKMIDLNKYKDFEFSFHPKQLTK